MRSALRILGLVGALLMLTLSLLATNSPPRPAAIDTNFLDPDIISDSPQIKQLMDQMKKEGVKPDSILDTHFLFASLIWGSVGGGYLLYARKQRTVVPFVGGVAMIAASFLVFSWLWMSLVCVGLMIAVYKLIEWG